MYAEQPKSISLSLSRHYQAESSVSHEANKDETQVRQFSLGFSFAGLDSLIARFGKERGLFQAVLGTMLNIWTLRQEMLGEMDTRELITLVCQEGGKLKYKNDLYGQAQDLEDMYLKGLNAVTDPGQKHRYLREANQAISTFKALSERLTQIDFDLPPALLSSQLKLNGFHEEEIDVSPSMLANVGSLRDQLQTIDDLEHVIQSQPKIKVLVGPSQLLTVSPPHWSHHRGETGFVWLSECVVIPETKEAFIRQSGKFGKAKLQDLLPYLSYFETQAREFGSETELMQFAATIMEADYHQPKVILDFLVQHLGNLKPVGKIDRQIRPGHLEIRDYFQAVQQLFTFEYERSQTTQNLGVLERLDHFSDLMKHQIARNEPKALPGLLTTYTQLLSQGQSSASTSASFLSNLKSQALTLDRGFKVNIDFSLLDCVSGTPFSLMNANSLSSLKLSLPKSLGSQGELEAFVNKYRSEGLLSGDASRYSTRGRCRMCGQETFIWSVENGGCNVCPVCEAKDNLAHLYSSSASDNSEGAGYPPSLGYESQTTGPMNLNDTVASCFIPIKKLQEAHF